MKKSKFSRRNWITVMADRVEWSDHPVKKAIEFLDIGIEAGLSNAEAEKFVNAACTGSLYNIDRTSAEDLFGKLQEVLDENEPFDQKTNLEPKTSFEVILTEVGANKIGVIKEVRAAVPGLGLAEAKALVEGAPKTVREGVTKEEAEEIKMKIEVRTPVQN